MKGYDTNYEAFGELIREGHIQGRRGVGGQGDLNSHSMWESENFHSQLAGTILF